MKRAREILNVQERIEPLKSHFINAELFPNAKTKYKCSRCFHENEISITPYQTGYPLSELLNKSLLGLDEMIHQNMVTPSARSSSHLGAYLVNNLPTLYFITTCANCNRDYLVIFGCGEAQPSKWMCVISGVWANDTKR
jgi:hypothetical protein